LIKLVFAEVLQQAMNQFLNLTSTHHMAILKRHDGKVLQLNITDFQQTGYFVMRKDRIYLYTHYGDKSDATISGSLFSLIRFALEFSTLLFSSLASSWTNVYTPGARFSTPSRKSNCFEYIKQICPPPKKNGLSIEGDMDFVHDIQLLLQQTSIPWEEYLSYLTGDLIANRLTLFCQKISTFTASTKKKSVADLLNYIQEEKRFLPTREEVEDFYEELTLLCQKIDRIEARYNRLDLSKFEGK
jgi:ubiquinone biosynthesis protein UbiJ